MQYYVVYVVTMLVWSASARAQRWLTLAGTPAQAPLVPCCFAPLQEKNFG